MAKRCCGRVVRAVADDCLQLHGGYGYMKDYPVEKYMRDAKITQIYEGTNQVQRIVVARNLIKESRDLDYLKEYIPLPDHPNTLADIAREEAEKTEAPAL